MKQLISVFLVICMLLSFAIIAHATTYEELSPGSMGADVINLQRRLTELGYDTKGVDGSYGDGTKNAVNSFQQRNGLKANGIATVETQEVLFSANAIKVFKPDIEITSVAYYGMNTVSVYYKNNLDVAVDAVYIGGYGSDATGKIKGFARLPKDEYYGYMGHWSCSESILQPGQSMSAYLGTDDDYGLGLKYYSLYVTGYHTVDGIEYNYSPDQIKIVRSDSATIEPSNEKPAPSMSDDIIEQMETFNFGGKLGKIYPWFVQYYGFHEGLVLFDMQENGCLEKAGLVEKDVITAFDDEPALKGFARAHAVMKILDGEQVTVHYIHANQEYTTIIAMDMDNIIKNAGISEPEVDSEGNVADKLILLAELYKDGLLTEEQFEAAKTKLLG